MGIKENITFLRGDVSNQSQNIFLYFFEKYPQHLKHFPDYVGKSPEKLRKDDKFPGHVQKVVSLLLEVAERSGDKAASAADGDMLVKMQQHVDLTTTEFQDLFTALVGYLGNTVGSACDTAAWNSVSKNVVAALKSAGMK